MASRSSGDRPRLGRIATVMAFVADPPAAARFWAGALGVPERPGEALVDAGEVELFFHAADPARNPQGGTVPYFATTDFDGSRERLLDAGCVPHRGPLVLEDGRRICQLRDPFGTAWGLEETAVTTAREAAAGRPAGGRRR